MRLSPDRPNVTRVTDARRGARHDAARDVRDPRSQPRPRTADTADGACPPDASRRSPGGTPEGRGRTPASHPLSMEVGPCP